jgi:hypothetical protein
MNDNNISVLDWVKKTLKDPKSWLGRSLKGESKPSRKTEIRVEEGENHPETEGIQEAKPIGSATGNALVQVDISIIVPAGSSIELDVTPGGENGKPHRWLNVSPHIEKVWFEVNPSPGEIISRKVEKGIKTGPPLGIGNFRISISLVTVLVILSLFLYTFTRFAGLSRFPAFFFSDEAMQTIFAEKLIDNHFLAANNKNIPVYVTVEGNRWSPMASIYVQAATVLLFGKSILKPELRPY